MPSGVGVGVGLGLGVPPDVGDRPPVPAGPLELVAGAGAGVCSGPRG
jgi:hypothetical protein